MGWLNILNGSEGEKYSWAPDAPQDVQVAREKFNHYMKQGFIACKIIHQGKTGLQISEFDPEAEEIFMIGLTDGG